MQAGLFRLKGMNFAHERVKFTTFNLRRQYIRKNCEMQAVGLQYILDSGKKKDEGFARIGYCEFNKSNKDRKEVQIPHDNCNTGHEVQAIPNVLREEIWRSTSVAEI